MLEFNEQHKSADLSPIKSKMDKVKQVGKVIICGILISATVLFSGCGLQHSEVAMAMNPEVTSTAIIVENDNAIIVDIKDSRNATNVFVLTTTTGEQIVVGVNNVHIIEDENSREIAEIMAQSLVSENGKLTYYEDIIEHEISNIRD